MGAFLWEKIHESSEPFLKFLEPVFVIYTFLENHVLVGLHIYCFD